MEEIAELREVAREVALELVDDPSWVAGLVLYWAEGTKGRNKVSMANADPRALRLFVRWVKTFVEPEAEFSIQLHLHEGNDEARARRYWLEETRLHDANFHKTFVKPAGTGNRKNHLEHGICPVRMRRSADAWNIIMEWIETASLRFDLPSAA